MGKWQNDTMLDTGLDWISTNATEMYVCTAQPTDRANAIATALTATVAPTFQANADGDVSGRKKPVDAKAGVSINATGDATHVAICSGTTLLYVTTSTLQTLTSGGTVTIPTWDVELEDVTP
jgi:hypothetical protein